VGGVTAALRSVAWLKTARGGIESQVRKRGRIDLNRSLIYLHPSFQSDPSFIWPSSTRSQKNYSQVEKILGHSVITSTVY